MFTLVTSAPRHRLPRDARDLEALAGIRWVIAAHTTSHDRKLRLSPSRRMAGFPVRRICAGRAGVEVCAALCRQTVTDVL
jgi:hypothetical protein